MSTQQMNWKNASLTEIEHALDEHGYDYLERTDLKNIIRELINRIDDLRDSALEAYE